jgi:DNA-binding NarL/FixJ family response regulator
VLRKVFIVDDHPLIRKGLKQLLAESGEFEVLAEAGSIEEARQKLQGCYDAVILDLSMPRGSSLDLLESLRLLPYPPKVLILSVHSEEEYGIRVLKAGAAGFLNKECAPELLITALRRICAGGRYISPNLAELLASQVGGGREAPRHETLSNREHRVLLMMGSGMTPGQIARELRLSVKTVSTYRARILEKLGLNTNAQLIHYALTHGLARPGGAAVGRAKRRRTGKKRALAGGAAAGASAGL